MPVKCETILLLAVPLIVQHTNENKEETDKQVHARTHLHKWLTVALPFSCISFQFNAKAKYFLPLKIQRAIHQVAGRLCIYLFGRQATKIVWKKMVELPFAPPQIPFAF